MSFCKIPASLGGLGDTGSVAAAVYDGSSRIKGAIKWARLELNCMGLSRQFPLFHGSKKSFPAWAYAIKGAGSNKRLE